MDGLTAFFFGQLALLLVPGPTNALLAASGATVGVSRSLPLLLFEIVGYELAVALARGLIAPVLAHAPWVTPIIRAAAALYLLGLAVSLWRTRWAAGARLVRGHHMLVTTLLNPKTLLTALVLWPVSRAASAWLILSALLPLAATAWLCVGALTRSEQPASFRSSRA